MVWYGMVWYGMVWYGNCAIIDTMVYHDLEMSDCIAMEMTTIQNTSFFFQAARTDFDPETWQDFTC